MKYFIVVALLLVLPSLIVAQPRIDTLKTGKEVGGIRNLRLHTRDGEVFHYHVNKKSLVTAKNSDELLEITGLRPDDKSTYSVNYFLTVSQRKVRNDGATDFQVRIDSIRSALNDNGKIESYSSNRSEDMQNPAFEDKALYIGVDFGAIVDPLGDIKEIYGYYGITGKLLSEIADSLQTVNVQDSISILVEGNIRKIIGHMFCNLPQRNLQPNDTLHSTWNEDYAVWSTLQFPVQKDFRYIVTGVEERDNRTYMVFNSETVITPVERVLDEPEYHTTLPSYSFLNKDKYYIDLETGMLAFDKWTEDQTYGLKIESKLPEKSGKSFVTVQHSKVETVVELLR